MTVQITRVESRRERSEFVAVPWSIYPGRYPRWVPPLRIMVKEMLDPEHDPFWKNADRALFLARRDGRPVGRIAAIENRRHNEVHDDRVGFFGFFECPDDQEVANALFSAAAEWLAGRGLDRMRGPCSPSMNHESGLLVDGFDEHPTLMTAWNPPYYEGLVRTAGFAPAKDLLAYLFERGFQTPERLARIVARRAPDSGIVLRDLDPGHLDEVATAVRPLFNAAWKDNWGFVPMTADEFRFTAHSMKPLLKKPLTMVAEKDGRPVGFCMVVTDLNRVLTRIRSGRLGPLALLRLLLGIRRVRHTRVVLLGLDPEHRQGIVLPLLLHELIERGHRHGRVSGEASWVLEDNAAIRTPLESLGIEPYRRWTIFEKAIDPERGPVPAAEPGPA